MASNVYDNNLNTRWSAEESQWLVMDLGEEKKISYIELLSLTAHRGRQNTSLVSIDNETWTPLFNGLSSGTTNDIEVTEKLDISARYKIYRIREHGEQMEQHYGVCGLV